MVFWVVDPVAISPTLCARIQMCELTDFNCESHSMRVLPSWTWIAASAAILDEFDSFPNNAIFSCLRSVLDVLLLSW